MKYRTRWLLKRGSDNARTKLEVAADAIYRAAGVAVPRSYYLTEETGTGWRAIEEVEGSTLGVWWETALPLETARVAAQIRSGFVVDVLLGNLDVAGKTQANIVVDRHGKPWRVDNGDALQWEPLSGTKRGRRSVHEVAVALRGGSATQCLFGALTNAEVGEQLAALDTKHLVNAWPAHYRTDLSLRLVEMRQIWPAAAKAADLPAAAESVKHPQP